MSSDGPSRRGPRRRSGRPPGAVLALLLLGQLAAGAAMLLVAAPVPGLLGTLALACAPAPAVVAALTLRPRAAGGVTLADLVTLLRHLAAGPLATAAVLVLGGEMSARSGALALLAGAALATDVLDGPVARRTGTAGPIGARIDMEADAALVLVMSVLAAAVVGPWALAIGLMRYAYVAASFLRPALRRPLGFSQARRVIGGSQGVALLTAVVPAVPVPVATAVVALALGLLILSFGRDVIGQERAQAREAGRSWR